jgi:hypothetical protein
MNDPALLQSLVSAAKPQEEPAASEPAGTTEE